MKSLKIKLHNLKITRYTTLTNLNITLARTGQHDGLFTDDEAAKLIEYLETQPIDDQVKISDIRCYDAVTIDDETGKTKLYSPYMMSFGTGGFKENLRNWCEQYPLDFDVEILFYEYDSDYQCIRTHLESTYQRKQKEDIAKIKLSLTKAGCTQDEINKTLEEMRSA